MSRAEVVELMRKTILQIEDMEDLDAVDITIIHSAVSSDEKEDWVVTTHLRTRSK